MMAAIVDDLALCPECGAKCFPLNDRRARTTVNCCLGCQARFRIVSVGSRIFYQVQEWDESIRTFIWRNRPHPDTQEARKGWACIKEPVTSAVNAQEQPRSSTDGRDRT